MPTEERPIPDLTDAELDFAIVDYLVCYWHLDNLDRLETFETITWKGAGLAPLVREWITRHPVVQHAN
jgi:hypothetical protein